MNAGKTSVFGNRAISCFSGYASRPTMIEPLEERTFLSASPALPPIAALAHGQGNHAGIIFQLLNQGDKGGHDLGDHHGIGNVLKDVRGLNITVTSVQLQNGSLVVNGMIGKNPFSTTASLELPTAATAGSLSAQVVNAATTSILNLHLNAIHLSLLGLNVDTSNICVGINAQSGPGNLLGNLLTDVANLLNGGTPLSGILNGLTSTQLTTLLNGVTGLLNGVLGNLLGGAATTGGALGGLTAAAAPTTTSILHLSLGPVNLNLLGLNVNVDNCANGPVTVDVTATSGPGNLLGNLLTGVSNLLNGSSNPQASQLLNRILGDVLTLL